MNATETQFNSPATDALKPSLTSKTARAVGTIAAATSLYGKAVALTLVAMVAFVAIFGMPTTIPETARVEASLWTRMWMKPKSTVAKNHLIYTQVDRDFGKHGTYRLTADDKGYVYRKVK